MNFRISDLLSSSPLFVSILRHGCFLLVLGLGPGVRAQSLIIESRAGGKNADRYSEPAGAWRDSDTPPNFAKSAAPGLTPQGRLGTRKFVTSGGAPTATGAPLALARFTPDFPNPGRYRVEVTWPKGANAGPVRYLIRHAGGTEVVPMIQNGFGAHGTSNAGVWHSLGEYDFAPGREHYVELQVMPDTRPIDTRNACQAFADAMRFTAVGPAGLSPEAGASAAGGAAVSSTAAPSAAPAVRWLESIAEATAEAARTNRKILIYFYSPASERTTRYEKEVLADPAVAAVLNARFVPVRINIVAETELAARMRTYKAGTINIYDGKGQGLGQITDMIPASELAARLSAF